MELAKPLPAMPLHCLYLIRFPACLQHQRRCPRVPRLILFCGAMLLYGAFAPAAQTIIRENDPISYLPRITDQLCKLSHDGRHVALCVSSKDGFEIIRCDIEKPEDIQTLAQARSFAQRLVPVYWAPSGRFVFRDEQHHYFIASGANAESRGSADLPLLLTEKPDHAKPPSKQVVRFFARSMDDPECVLFTRTSQTRIEQPDDTPQTQIFLLKADLRTGQTTILYSGVHEGRVLFDRQGRARVLQEEPAYSATRDDILLQQDDKTRAISLDRHLGKTLPVAFRWSDKNYFGPRSVPLGLGEDPEILYYASNVGRDTFGLYALNLRTSARTTFALENPTQDLFDPTETDSAEPVVVYDPTKSKVVGLRLPSGTHWLDTELADVQTTLEKKLPERQVRLLEWNETRTRFLLLATSMEDPGRYYVYDRATRHLLHLLRVNPVLQMDAVNPTQTWSTITPNGTTLHGSLTKPRHIARIPPPAIVLVHDAPWKPGASAGYSGEAQILARQGFLVVQLEYRGSRGHGLRHLNAIRRGFDRVPLEDVRAALAWLATQQRYDTRRVAVLGHGFGGNLALRAVQLYPEEFCCAIAINAPLNLDRDSENPSAKGYNAIVQSMQQSTSISESPIMTMPKGDDETYKSFLSLPSLPMSVGTYDFSASVRREFYGEPAALRISSPMTYADKQTRPALLIYDMSAKAADIAQAKVLCDSLKRNQRAVELAEIKGRMKLGQTMLFAQAYAHIGEFLSRHIFDTKSENTSK
ncbi:MAG: alpha/beta fold hydrolase [Opitutae bacterium]|nr:alpha/beta fold hydrolase [Opitutae bacterium]